MPRITEPDEPSRLDRLEALAASLLSSLQEERTIRTLEIQREQEIRGTELAALQESQNVDRAEFRAFVQDSLQGIGILAETSERQLTAIQEMQSEVKGLQTENRRILQRLENHFSDGHGAA